MSVVLSEHLPLLASAPDGIQKLRGLILELAVRGKLVPQDPADEPASELLKRITLERVRLEAKGLCKKSKPLPPVNCDEQPFALPSNWVWVRLPDVYFSISPSSNKLLSSAIQETGTVPVVDQGKRYIAGYTDQVSMLIKIPGPVVIFGDHTTERKYVDFDFVAGADGVKILRPILQYEKFFFRQLQGFKLEERGYARHFKVLNDQLYALPPLAEQHRIVAKVDELMALCDRLEAEQADAGSAHARLVETLLGTLTQSTDAADLAANWQRLAEHFDTLFSTEASIDALKQTVLQLAVMGKLVPQDPSDKPASELLKGIAIERERLEARGVCKNLKPLSRVARIEQPFQAPKGWEWVRWVEIAQKIGDIDHKMPDTVKDGIPYVSPRDFYPDNRIDFEGAKKISRGDFLRLSAKIRPEVGDIIYPRYGTIGENRLVVDDLEFLASYSCCVIKTLNNFVEPKYQFYFSISQCCRDQAKAAENKTTQANVGIKSIQEFAFPLPPLREQQRIVVKVDKLMALCDSLKADLVTTRRRQVTLADTLIESALEAA